MTTAAPVMADPKPPARTPAEIIHAAPHAPIAATVAIRRSITERSTR